MYTGSEKSFFFLAAKRNFQNFLPLKAPSTQLEIFKSRGTIDEKGTLNLLIEDTVCEYCFSDPLVEEHRGRFTVIIALKNNHSYC